MWLYFQRQLKSGGPGCHPAAERQRAGCLHLSALGLSRGRCLRPGSRRQVSQPAVAPGGSEAARPNTGHLDLASWLPWRSRSARGSVGGGAIMWPCGFTEEHLTLQAAGRSQIPGHPPAAAAALSDLPNPPLPAIFRDPREVPQRHSDFMSPPRSPTPSWPWTPRSASSASAQGCPAYKRGSC